MNWSTISPGWKTLTTRTEVLHVLWPLHVLQSCQVANRLSFRITALAIIEPMFQSGNGFGIADGEAGGWGARCRLREGRHLHGCRAQRRPDGLLLAAECPDPKAIGAGGAREERAPALFTSPLLCWCAGCTMRRSCSCRGT